MEIMGGSPHYAYVSRYCRRVACAVLLTQMNILWFLGNYGKILHYLPIPILKINISCASAMRLCSMHNSPKLS